MDGIIHRPSSRARHLTLKMDATGQVVVVSPPGIRTERIQRFIHDNLAWITKQRQQLALKLQPITHHKVHIFGQQFQRTIVPDSAHQKIFTKGEQLFQHFLTDQPTPSQIKTQLDRFLKTNAQKYILERTHQLAQKMKVEFKQLRFKQQKSRWGSCSSQKNLNFNWKLVHYPPPIIDYVIVHELAHLTHLDHSRRFWALVAKFDPDYQTHRRWLKRHGLTC